MENSQSEISHSKKISYPGEAEKEGPCLYSTALGLPKAYGTKMKRVCGEESSATPSSCRVLSTETIMKLARARLLQLNSQTCDVFFILANRYGDQLCSPFKSFDDLELAMLLQASAEKVAEKKFACASKLLGMCDLSASRNGNPLQRVVYYFAEALRERIDRERGIVSNGAQKGKIWKPLDEEQTLISLETAVMASQQDLPISVITQFTGIQSILDSVATAKRVHLIDFGIKNGSHWTVMVQALAVRSEFPVELLKITAVGTCKEFIEEIGKRLSSFAETMSLPFSFKVVLSELNEINEDLFDFEANETVAVYLSMRLWSLLAWPDSLEALIGVIKNLKPCLMVVNELETRINAPAFLERFTEALFFFCASFDCMEVCLRDHRLCRKLNEENFQWEMIRNIIVNEGTARFQRFERIDFWRALFAKFDIVETELTASALCLANLLLKRSTCHSYYTLAMDGKCLSMGWKGTPIESISAWKFQND